jgi:peptidoglycan/LPS O-acetylase OafA/YrhL
MTMHPPARRWQAARFLLTLANIAGTLGLLIAGAALYTSTGLDHTPARLDLFAAALVALVIAFTCETTGTRLRNRARAERPTVRR